MAHPSLDTSHVIAGAPSQASGNETLAPEIVDLAVAELRYQTAYYLEIVQAMMDGVTLGAEQVQDKRLEFLELGPTTDPSKVILTIVLTLVLEGTVGPAIASLATRIALRPMIRAMGKAITFQSRRKASALAKEMRLFRKVESSIRRSIGGSPIDDPYTRIRKVDAESVKRAADVLRGNLREQLGKAKPVRDALQRVTAFVEMNLVATAKAPLAVSTNVPGTSAQLQSKNTPGVSVLADAMASASRLRLTVVATHEALEAEIKRPNIAIGEVVTILEDYRVDGWVELEQIRDSFQLATEAMIWAHLFIDTSMEAKIRNRSGDVAPGERGVEASSAFLASLMTPMRIDVDEKYSKYLLVRFGKEVERWALETNARVPSETLLSKQSLLRTTGWWEGLKPEERDDLLVQYLSAVSKATPEFKLKK